MTSEVCKAKNLKTRTEGGKLSSVKSRHYVQIILCDRKLNAYCIYTSQDMIFFFFLVHHLKNGRLLYNCQVKQFQYGYPEKGRGGCHIEENMAVMTKHLCTLVNGSRRQL